MARSILEAVRDGHWDYEPAPCRLDAFQPTQAIPGSDEKLSILCERVRRGLPLWHPADRRYYDGSCQQPRDRAAQHY